MLASWVILIQARWENTPKSGLLWAIGPWWCAPSSISVHREVENAAASRDRARNIQHKARLTHGKMKSTFLPQVSRLLCAISQFLTAGNQFRYFKKCYIDYANLWRASLGQRTISMSLCWMLLYETLQHSGYHLSFFFPCATLYPRDPAEWKNKAIVCFFRF